tara:strand:+ start:1313 stop:2161 length:849 start_codon:yes stop_codon:yes gene_type:complete
MRKILLTGATGFLGKQILNQLDNQEVSIRVISRSKQEDFFSNYKKVTEIIETKNFFNESNDIYKQICEGVDTVIHVAWYAEPGKYLESPINLECLSGTLNFAQAASQQGVRKFVGVGTCFEYDLTSSKPLGINDPLNPLFLYSEAKTAAFKILSRFFKSEDIDFLWTRVFYLFGEGEDERRLVAALRSKLAIGEPIDLTSGSQIRDFMDVKDAGALIADASLGLNVGPFNVCSGEEISIKELAEEIADEYGKRDLLNFGAREENLSDASYVVGIKSEVIPFK